MSEKKSALATSNDQGKSNTTTLEENTKSPAPNQENSQKSLTAGVAKQFVRLKSADPRYIPTNPYFQKAWADFETRCKDVGVTNRDNINNFEN